MEKKIESIGPEIPIIRIRIVKAHTRGAIGDRIRAAIGREFGASANCFERIDLQDCRPLTLEIGLFGCHTRLFEGEWEFVDPKIRSEMWE